MNIACCRWALVLAVLPIAAQAEEVLAPRQGRTFTTRVQSNSPDFHSDAIIKHEVIASDGLNATIHNTYPDSMPVPAREETVAVSSPDNVTTTKAFLGVGYKLFTRPVSDPDQPARLVTVDLVCDEAGLMQFLPIGHVSNVIVPCVWLSSLGDQASLPIEFNAAIIYDGRTTITTSLGQVSVQTIHVVMPYADIGVMETRYQFDDTRGLSLLTEQTSTSLGQIRRTRSEVTEIGP